MSVHKPLTPHHLRASELRNDVHQDMFLALAFLPNSQSSAWAQRPWQNRRNSGTTNRLASGMKPYPSETEDWGA